MPDTPTGTAYQGATCRAVNTRLEPIDDLETEVPIARIVCETPASGQFDYRIVCNRDRTPKSVADFTDGLTAVRDEAWSRGNGSGRVVYGIRSSSGGGNLAVSFDSPARNFCAVFVFGVKGSTGQDVYNGWFRDAPLSG